MTARLHSLRHQDKKSAGSSNSSSNNGSNNGSSNHRQHHHQQGVHQGPSPAPSPSPSLSPSPKHSDGRRANKPLMEKRRRARINQSLAALKALILDSARLENTKHSKLEKADILELTVRHLQRQRSLAQPGLSRYKAGYQDCSREVSRYLDAPEIITGNTTPMDPAVKQRLLRHLDSCVSELDLDLGSRPDSGLGSSPGSVTDRVTGATSPGPLEHHVPSTAHCSTVLNPASLIKSELPDMEATRPDSSTTAGDENNNSSRPTSAFGQINPTGLDHHHPSAGIPVDQASTSQQNPNMLSVVQVIPSRLPDGQVVFLLPSHYVQLAAAAAANGISIGPNPPTAIWAATNMSLLKATDKLAKRPHDEIQEWQDADTAAVSAAAAAAAAASGTGTVNATGTTGAAVNITAATTTTGTGTGIGMGSGSGTTTSNGSILSPVTSTAAKPSKSPRIEQPEQPLDFTTTSKKLKVATRNPMYSVAVMEHHLQQPQLLQLPSSRLSSDGSMVHEERPSSYVDSELGAGIRSPSPLAQQPVKDEEGMWRPW